MLNHIKQYDYAANLSGILWDHSPTQKILKALQKYKGIYLIAETVVRPVLNQMFKYYPDYRFDTLKIAVPDHLNPDNLKEMLDPFVQGYLLELDIKKYKKNIYEILYDQPFTLTSIAVSLSDDKLECVAPYGLHDLFKKTLRPALFYLYDHQDYDRKMQAFLHDYQDMIITKTESDKPDKHDMFVTPVPSAAKTVLDLALDGPVYVRTPEEKLDQYTPFPYERAEIVDFTHFRSCGFCAVVRSHDKTIPNQSIPVSELNKKLFVIPDKMG